MAFRIRDILPGTSEASAQLISMGLALLHLPRPTVLYRTTEPGRLRGYFSPGLMRVGLGHLSHRRSYPAPSCWDLEHHFRPEAGLPPH